MATVLSMALIYHLLSWASPLGEFEVVKLRNVTTNAPVQEYSIDCGKQITLLRSFCRCASSDGLGVGRQSLVVAMGKTLLVSLCAYRSMFNLQADWLQCVGYQSGPSICRKDVGSYARCRSTRFECHMLSKVKEIALDELQSAHVKPSEGDDEVAQVNRPALKRIKLKLEGASMRKFSMKDRT
jgi:hypothetical protein